MKKYVAECIGTAVLVVLGCGTAMLVGCDAANGSGYLLTALAFGLVIVGMAYSIGNISGCHINPAVSLGVLMTGGMTVSDFVGYVISQCIGAFAGAHVQPPQVDLHIVPLGGGQIIGQKSVFHGGDAVCPGFRVQFKHVPAPLALWLRRAFPSCPA